MRKVVDTNFMQSVLLDTYLSGSRNNYAVLTDYAAMEAHKGDTLPWIYDRMAILAKYPKQVIVLKSTKEVCGLTGGEAVSKGALIDKPQTHGFSEYCLYLDSAKRGDQPLQHQLLERGREASAHLDRMLLDMPTLASGIDLITKEFSPDELKILRRRELPTEEMRAKMIEHVVSLAAEFFKGHLGLADSPKYPEARNRFAFRYAVCGYASILKRIEDGGAGKSRPEKLRNDVVDMNFASFATYFDGFLTADKRASEIYEDVEFLLREVFAMPPRWLGWLLRRVFPLRKV